MKHEAAPPAVEPAATPEVAAPEATPQANQQAIPPEPETPSGEKEQ
jgi:hypothetical protein